MFERTVNLGINEAYADLKALLLRKGCRIVAEEPPTFISVNHGSLWAISPRTAKKVARYRLSQVGSGTRITVSPSLASDWRNLNIIGSALAAPYHGILLVDYHGLGSVYDYARAQLLELDSHGG